MIIETSNLQLISCDVQTLEAAIKSNEELAKILNVNVPDQWTEFGDEPLKYAIQILTKKEQDKDWWTYLPIHKGDKKLIGSCGFKGSPDENGNVEIGYEIIESYREKGFATEVAQGLISRAFAEPKVNKVLAHTLGFSNASTSVLTKCGFIKTEEIMDPDEGPIWQWQLDRSSYTKS